jgi:hypothetical protein
MGEKKKLIVKLDVYYYGYIVLVLLQSCYAAPFQKKAVIKGLSKPWQVTMSNTGRVLPEIPS